VSRIFQVFAFVISSVSSVFMYLYMARTWGAIPEVGNLILIFTAGTAVPFMISNYLQMAHQDYIAKNVRGAFGLLNVTPLRNLIVISATTHWIILYYFVMRLDAFSVPINFFLSAILSFSTLFSAISYIFAFNQGRIGVFLLLSGLPSIFGIAGIYVSTDVYQLMYWIVSGHMLQASISIKFRIVNLEFEYTPDTLTKLSKSQIVNNMILAFAPLVSRLVYQTVAPLSFAVFAYAEKLANFQQGALNRVNTQDIYQKYMMNKNAISTKTKFVQFYVFLVTICSTMIVFSTPITSIIFPNQVDLGTSVSDVSRIFAVLQLWIIASALNIHWNNIYQTLGYHRVIVGLTFSFWTVFALTTFVFPIYKGGSNFAICLSLSSILVCYLRLLFNYIDHRSHRHQRSENFGGVVSVVSLGLSLAMFSYLATYSRSITLQLTVLLIVCCSSLFVVNNVRRGKIQFSS
jgi:hypothetical protein